MLSAVRCLSSVACLLHGLRDGADHPKPDRMEAKATHGTTLNLEAKSAREVRRL